jgi:riboflavin kinase/FMN adenylyltransferase
MIVLHDAPDTTNAPEASVVAIGVFDGLHLGHQRVIATLLALAEQHGARPTVVTFDPHPAWVLAPERAPRLIGTLEQRLEGFEALGVEVVRVLRFDPELAAEPGEDFIERVLVDELRTLSVVVGEDFRFGHERHGDVELLTHGGTRWDFEVVAAPIYGSSYRWSSTMVRRALTDGDLDAANHTLGRAFVLRGAVVHGDARGGDLGFPTANLATAQRQLLPAVGIYAGAARLADATWRPAAISVGTRPQFYEAGDVLVEVHLPGFDGDLYDSQLDVAFVRRLRGEMTFSSVEELIGQIDRDVHQTEGIFEEFTENTSALLGWELGQRR